MGYVKYQVFRTMLLLTCFQGLSEHRVQMDFVSLKLNE